MSNLTFFVCHYSSSQMCSASVPWDKFYLNGHDVTIIDEMLHILTYICIRCTRPRAVKFHMNISINVHPKNFECQLSSSLHVEYFFIFDFQWCMRTFFFLVLYTCLSTITILAPKLAPTNIWPGFKSWSGHNVGI